MTGVWKYLVSGTKRHYFKTDSQLAVCGKEIYFFTEHLWYGDKKGLNSREICDPCKKWLNNNNVPFEDK